MKRHMEQAGGPQKKYKVKVKTQPTAVDLVRAERADFLDICDWLDEPEYPEDPTSSSGFMHNLKQIYESVKAGECVLFKSDRQFLGFATTRDFARNGERAREVDIFHIRTGLRRKGFGRLAVKALAGAAREAKIDCLTVNPLPHRDAWQFWRACGMEYLVSYFPADAKMEAENDQKIEERGTPLYHQTTGWIRVTPPRTEPFPPDRANGDYYCPGCDLFWPKDKFPSNQLLLDKKLRQCDMHRT